MKKFCGMKWRLPAFAILLLGLLFLFPRCRQKPHYEAGISDIRLEKVTIRRYEELLFSLDPYRLREEIRPHAETFQFFLGDAIDDPLAMQQLFAYVTDPLLQELYQETKEVWPELTGLEEDLTRAFRYYRAHFPDEPIPQLYSYVSGIDYKLPIKYAGNHAAIGLDNYLGSDCPHYGKIGIPAYQVMTMEPDFVPLDMMKILAEVHLQEEPYEPETLLDFMIYEGKMLYFLDCMFPRAPDSLKAAYTGDQLRWMQEGKGMVWSYFIDNELLFSTDRQMISRLVGEAPFTSVFGRGSAPRTASWTGWQIVREYMRRHPEVSLPELLGMHDANRILHESRYRGR